MAKINFMYPNQIKQILLIMHYSREKCCGVQEKCCELHEWCFSLN